MSLVFMSKNKEKSKWMEIYQEFQALTWETGACPLQRRDWEKLGSNYRSLQKKGRTSEVGSVPQPRPQLQPLKWQCDHTQLRSSHDLSHEVQHCHLIEREPGKRAPSPESLGPNLSLNSL